MILKETFVSLGTFFSGGESRISPYFFVFLLRQSSGCVPAAKTGEDRKDQEGRGVGSWEKIGEIRKDVGLRAWRRSERLGRTWG